MSFSCIIFLYSDSVFMLPLIDTQFITLGELWSCLECLMSTPRVEYLRLIIQSHCRLNMPQFSQPVFAWSPQWNNSPLLLAPSGSSGVSARPISNPWEWLPDFRCHATCGSVCRQSHPRQDRLWPHDLCWQGERFFIVFNVWLIKVRRLLSVTEALWFPPSALRQSRQAR